jgi:hypothetical protein
MELPAGVIHQSFGEFVSELEFSFFPIGSHREVGSSRCGGESRTFAVVRRRYRNWRRARDHRSSHMAISRVNEASR